MTPTSPAVQSFATMFAGFEQALQRFELASQEVDPGAAYLPLFEALNWSVVLDDRAGELWKPEGKALGWGWRAQVSGAEVMAGVRFARNRAHHQWSDALRHDTSGFQFPMRFPLQFREWVWRAAGELPSGRPDPAGEQIYRDRLQGKAARATLSEISAAFAYLRQIFEPTVAADPHA